ncbi:MAG: PQQ-binding-like beta-propeller repeat protein, partial [Myxococcales bacterium]|nr:PQQ-binding-like beta-propeller repeat protein [Myxococcales bacterium]
TVVAVSGVDGHSIWSVSLRDEVFTRPVTLLIDDDCTPDVVIGGRRGLLIAVSGATGDVIWSFNDGVDPGDDGIFNWFTPQVVPDLDGDGRPELLLANGGDATAPPFSPRPPGHVMILDAETGEILRSATTPDLRETYMSPLLLDRLGEPWLLVGTGGETAQGALWIVRYSDLLDEDLSDATQLTTPTTTKGVMAPPSLADLNGDGQRDIVVSVFDGRTIAIDGVTLEPLWTFTTPRQAESYQSPAIARLDELDGDDVFAVFTYGVFPNYTGVYRVALSGRTGAVLWSDEAAENVTCSPLAADLDGDGRDELLHSAGMFGSAVSSHLDVLSGADRSGFTVLPRDTASVGAGWVGDLDGDGRLEWVTMSFRETESGGQWLIERRDLGAPSEPAPRWGAYLGSDGTGR